MKKLPLLISVSRPIVWPLGPLIFLAGIIYSGASIPTVGFLQLFLLSFPIGVIIFGINDIYDFKSDNLNPRKKQIEGIKLKPKYHKFVLEVGILFSFILIVSGILTLNHTNILAIVLLLIFAYSYSTPPIRLKERPILDSLSNGIIVFSLFLIGFSYGKSWNQLDVKILYAALCVAGFHAFTTVLDYKYDKKAGDNTFAVKYGKRTAILFAFILFLISILFGNFSQIILYFLFFCLILFFIGFIYPYEKAVKLISKLIYIGIIITAIVYLMLYL